jgi:hypothetical protein
MARSASAPYLAPRFRGANREFVRGAAELKLLPLNPAQITHIVHAQPAAERRVIESGAAEEFPDTGKFFGPAEAERETSDAGGDWHEMVKSPKSDLCRGVDQTN